MRDALLCGVCRHWDETHIAHPGPAPGSMRICHLGHETHAGSWKPCFELRTDQQQLEAANAAGRLF